VKNNTSKFRDPELWFIVLFNILLIYLYLNNDYDARFIIWGYYLQSVFIGVQYIGLSTIKKFKINRSFRPLRKHAFTLFFIMHFGLFHLVYFIFLLGMSLNGNVEQYLTLYNFVKITVATLILNSLFVFGKELAPGTSDYATPSVIAAYARIIPIHLFIIFSPMNSGIGGQSFLLFMGLKVLFDVIAYLFLQRLGHPTISQVNSNNTKL
jgi:hypothetical protein